MRLFQRLILAAVCVLAVAARAEFEANGLVVLCTDYGADSIYVGAIKGAIYTKHPQARVDSITNSIPPYDITAGAYVIAEACREFPPGTTFVTVVDPGVGTQRRCIVLETRSGQVFVGPDNGLLHVVAEQYGIEQLREADNRELWREGVQSSTFHGRDIFGPVAAVIAGGTPVQESGSELPEMVRLNLPQAATDGAQITGQVIRTDWYGNCVTNIGRELLEQLGLQEGNLVGVNVAGQQYAAPLVNTYADVPAGQPLVLIQSFGLVELAMNQSSLAERLGVATHAPVLLTRANVPAPVPGTEPAANVETGPIVTVFQRSGGIAGRIEELTIRRDGICTYKRADRTAGFNLSPEVIGELIASLAALPPAETLGEPKPGAGADQFNYELVWQGQMYRATDAQMPEPLQPVIVRLSGLIAKHARE